jgi:hypothetical protein
MPMKNMNCKRCEFLSEWQDISLLSRMMGYTAECRKNGVLFNIDDIEKIPPWCPLNDREDKIDKLP